MSSKFRNVPTVLNGIKFSSQLEAERYAELQLLVRSGEARDLRLQVRYELVPAVRFPGARRETTGIDYVADFVYFDCRRNREVIEDAKGMRTRVFLMKRHMLYAKTGIVIEEVRPRR